MRRDRTPRLRFIWPRKVAVAASIALFAVIIAAPPPTARADDTSVGGIGGAVYPTTSSDITMEAETVQAVLYGGFAEYRVDFRFVNDGPEQTLMLGFPFAVTRAEEGYQSYPPTAFRAWQDGRPLDVIVGRDVRQSDHRDGTIGYFLHEATFPRGPTTITVGYLTRPSRSSGNSFYEIARAQGFEGSTIVNDAWYDYWLHTGASWRGPIGKAVVRIAPADTVLGYGMDLTEADLGHPSPRLTSPETYTISSTGEFRWEFDDFEPGDAAEDGWSAYDVRFGFAQLQFADAAATTPPPAAGLRVVDVTAGSTKDWAESGEFAPRGAADGIPNTSWAEGVTGPGIGEALRFELAAESAVREVRILPGKNRETGIFGLCGRPKTVRMTFSDGSSAILDLADEPTVQRFPVEAQASWAELEILDSYPGTQQEDTYISEVEFGGEPAPRFISMERLLLQGAAAPPAESQVPPAEVVSTVPSTDPTASPADSGPAAPPVGHGEGALARDAIASAVLALLTVGLVAVMGFTVLRAHRARRTG